MKQRTFTLSTSLRRAALGLLLATAGAAQAQTAATITAVSPTPNARSAAPTSPVQVTFDKALATNSANALQVFSAQRGGRRTGIMPATVSGNQLTFTPSAFPYQPGETVQATVTTAAQSSDGGRLAVPRVFQFTTATGGSGRGGFGGGSDPAVGSNPNSVAVGDVNGDGFLDLVTANVISNTASVRLNNGQGSFGGGSEVSVGNRPFGIVLGDVDGDGDLDFVTANINSHTASVRLNNGQGSFSSGSDPSVGGNPYSVALGDVDGDGDLDLLTANAGSNTASVRLNNGQGSFSNGSEVPVGNSPGSVVLGDVDGDGDLDLLTVNSNSSTNNAGTVSVRLNDGQGKFSGAQEVPTNGNPQYGLALGDVDGDGDLDVLAGNNNGNSVAVRLNDGQGNFSGAQNVAVGNAYSVAVGDVDADGDLDFVTANGDGNTASVRLNDGQGKFSGAQNVAVGSGPAGVALGDVDGDGDLDFITANSNTGPNGTAGSVSVRLNLAPPTLTSLSPTSGPVGTRVTLTGTNFASASTVAFNGTAATAVTVASTTSLTATVPAGATSGNVTVTTPSGVSNGLPFTVVAPVTLTTASPLPSGTVGVAYSQTFQATGGSGTYTFTVAAGSALPPGLTLASTGTLAGTPTGGGSFTFTVQATDNSAAPGPYSGTKQYTLTVAAPTITLAPASPTLPSGTQGVAYSQTFTASGGTAPYSYALTAGALPNGLTLASSGVLSGTPTQNGPFNFTVTATDASTGSGPYNGSRSYTLTIAAPAVVAVSWTGMISTDWFTAGNWSPNQVPSASIDATIPASTPFQPVITSGSATATTRNLTINAGASLRMSDGTLDVRASLVNNGSFQPTGGTVNLGSTAQSSILGSGNTRFFNLSVGASGAQSNTSASTSVQRLLTLTGTFTTNANAFTLESSATGTALVVNNGGVVSGNATVQRYIDPSQNPGPGYRHFAAPIRNATVASLTTASYAPTVNPAYNTSAQPGSVQPFPTVFGYDQSRLATASNNLSAFDKGFYSPSALTDALRVGLGYTVNLAASQTLSLTGPPNNGDLSLSLSRNAVGTANDNSAGWQLLGNPYPAPLDYSQVAAADRQNLDAAIYVYQSTGPYVGQYRTVLGTIGNSVLPLGQAFFARVSQGQTSAAFTFRNSQRVTTYQNPAYQRSAETRPLVQLTLQGTGQTLADEATVYFEAGATAGVEPQYDAVKLPNPTGLNLMSQAASQPLAIDGQAPLGSSQRVVPLTLGVPTAGSYTLSAARLLNLGAVPVYLRDRLSGAVVDLAQQPSYQFTVSSAAALIQDRFELVFAPQQALATVPAALAQQVGLYPNPAHPGDAGAARPPG